MNLPLIVLIAAVLSYPAWRGMLTGSMDPDQAGPRIILAVLVSWAVERLSRLFVTAARPGDDTMASQNTEGDPPKGS